jgi:hypothetical protein
MGNIVADMKIDAEGGAGEGRARGTLTLRPICTTGLCDALLLFILVGNDPLHKDTP